MINALPTVTRVGHFDSRVVLGDLPKSTPRVVETYELELFSADGGTCSINGELQTIRKGDVVLVKPGSVRWSIFPVECYFVHFTVDDPDLVQLLDGMDGFGHTEHYDVMKALFGNIREVFISAEPMSQAVTRARLLELLWQLRRYIQSDGEALKKNPISKALSIIRRNFHSDISVEQLAEKCNLSVSYFHKLFVQTTGITPNRYLIMTRLTAAKAMLLSSDQPVAQVAESCGFSSQGYFCDCMKKYIGMSPRQFRRDANYPEEN
jgi:AraC-like DNA-binding protein